MSASGIAASPGREVRALEEFIARAARRRGVRPRRPERRGQEHAHRAAAGVPRAERGDGAHRRAGAAAVHRGARHRLPLRAGEHPARHGVYATKRCGATRCSPACRRRRARRTRRRGDRDARARGAPATSACGSSRKGNLQRLGLAQALLCDERVIVLDEPTHGLDPVWTQRFRDVVNALRRDGPADPHRVAQPRRAGAAGRPRRRSSTAAGCSASSTCAAHVSRDAGETDAVPHRAGARRGAAARRVSQRRAPIGQGEYELADMTLEAAQRRASPSCVARGALVSGGLPGALGARAAVPRGGRCRGGAAMSASIQVQAPGTTPIRGARPRKARMAAYALWQLRDYLMDRGTPDVHRRDALRVSAASCRFCEPRGAGSASRADRADSDSEAAARAAMLTRSSTRCSCAASSARSSSSARCSR